MPIYTAVRAVVDQRKVVATVLQVANQVSRRRMRFEVQLDQRVTLEKAIEFGSNVPIEQALPHEHAIAHSVFLIAPPAMRGQRLGRRPEDSQVLKERHPLRGQCGPLAGTARKQREAELLLKRFHLVAHRCLGDAEAFRAAPEAARGAEAGEDFQLAQCERKSGHYRFHPFT
jgi:hypothetical protein